MSTLSVSNITDGTDTVGTGYVVNGSAKAWCKFDAAATIADSFNISSSVDVAVGRWRFSKTNAMSSSNYTVVGTSGRVIDNFVAAHNSNSIESPANHTHSKYSVASLSWQDFGSGGYGMHTVHGDLA